MQPAPDLSARLRAVRPEVALVQARAVTDLRARPVPRVLRRRGVRVLVAGLILSALGHAAFALWIAHLPAVPPPDGPEVAATEVLILSGAQFSALTAPAPQTPEPAPQAPDPPTQDAAFLTPLDLPATQTVPRPASVAPPDAEQPPDLAALAVPLPDPQAAILLPQLVAPTLSETGVHIAPFPAAPRPEEAPPSPVPPETADTRPAVSEAAPAPPEEPAAKKRPPAEVGDAKPASAAGDNGKAESSRRPAAGAADARAAWLSAIRTRVERRKTYPAAAGGAEGRVTLQLTVDRAGRLSSVAVVRSSGNAVLDAAALRAVKAAGRFPKAPDDVAEAGVTFNLPLRYSAGS